MYYYTATPNMDDDPFAQIWMEAEKKIDEYGNERETGRNGFALISYMGQTSERDEEWATVEQGKIGEEHGREHNCEFIAFDETLIDSIKLSNMEARDPYAQMGLHVGIESLLKNHVYMIGLDPSLGNRGDNSAIQVYQMPGMKQVAEWMHNRTTVQGQIKVLREIAQYIETETGGESEIYYSVENNTLGEAALIVIEEQGEETIPGTFLTESKSHGNARRYRRGFTSTQIQNYSKPS